MTHYSTARRDFEWLEQIAELEDQDDLDARREELMQNPTKSRAAEMYQCAIRSWFGQHQISVVPDYKKRRANQIFDRHAI